MSPVLWIGVQGTFQDESTDVQQLQGTLITDTNFINIYVLKYLSLFLMISGNSFYTVDWKLKVLIKPIISL
jgi:hypothetical protein